MKHFRSIPIFLVSCILLTFFTPVLAVEVPSSTKVEPFVVTESFNEYTYISLLQQSTPQELHNIGLTTEKADMVVSEFEKALMERASLPDIQLEWLGYSNEEISILRAYLNGATLSESEFRAITATCTGSITRYWVTKNAARFGYSWEWDRCPVMMLSDAAAMRWIAHSEEGYEIGVIQKSVDLSIDYHCRVIGGSGPYAYTLPGTSEPNLDFNSINMQFSVWGSHLLPSGITDECYAKRGEVKVKIEVPSGSTQKISNIFVAGLYGHTTVGVGSPSLSVGNQHSVAISFTGNVGIDHLAPISATIYEAKEGVEVWDD